jgi:hypothetical protein
MAVVLCERVNRDGNWPFQCRSVSVEHLPSEDEWAIQLNRPKAIADEIVPQDILSKNEMDVILLH